MPGRRVNIADLVANFRAHIKAYKSKDTKEAEIRQQFIDPFWRALGWDVGDTKGVGPTESEVIIEKNVETVDVGGAGGLRSRRPDYLFRLGGFPRFIVEAKKPAIDIDEDRDAIFQAKQYAWNSTIPFAVLTDFEQFRLYDTTLKPVLNDPRRGLVKEFTLDYDKYESQWDAITAAFGREAVEGGSLERLLAGIKKVKAGKRLRTVDRALIDLKGGEPVDQVFLAYLDTHRRHFAAALYRENKAAFPEADTLHGAARLTEAVQRIMDRLVFMRVIEDRGIVPFGALREMLDRIGSEGGEFYSALCATFRDYDKRYNGYLFKPHFSEELSVDGGVLADFTRTLYPPDGPWDFAAIGDDILGTVYERFLGNTIVVRKGQASVEEKMEVRHAGGVYYTPRFVVDSIIRRVVGPKVQGKTPAEVLDVKILDPACGSGSFLVAALQYLFDYCLAAVNNRQGHRPGLESRQREQGAQEEVGNRLPGQGGKVVPRPRLPRRPPDPLHPRRGHRPAGRGGHGHVPVPENAGVQVARALGDALGRASVAAVLGQQHPVRQLAHRPRGVRRLRLLPPAATLWRGCRHRLPHQPLRLDQPHARVRAVARFAGGQGAGPCRV
jgi:hypothetical protein